uniref:ZnF_CDGSH domain-containing protein n=1 Tax=Strongyloides papillosus TaxID=174720 RepID=A0A0N5BEV6_STREA
MACGMPGGSCADTSAHTKVFVLGVALLGAGAALGYYLGQRASGKNRCNKKYKLDQAKVVDIIDVEDIGEKVSLCRCWKSEKFPYCDGSHNKHNEECNDNVGPCLIRKKPAQEQ